MELHKANRCRLFLLLGGGGLLLGTCLAAAASFCVADLMRLRENRVSIVLMYSVAFLALSTAAHAVMIQNWKLFFLVVFGRFFSAGFGLGACLSAFGASAWLAAPLYRFWEGACLVLFGVCGMKWCAAPPSRRMLWVCIVIAAAVAVFDFCAVSPFLAAVLHGRNTAPCWI